MRSTNLEVSRHPVAGNISKNINFNYLSAIMLYFKQAELE